MPRLMSVAFTEKAVVERRKTVTRRKGWTFIKPGDRLTLCRKVMGRKAGEPLVRLVDVEVVDVRREPLGLIYSEPNGLELEGLPDLTPGEFIARYFLPQGLDPWADVTRIEWRYL
jgi:hypothetical protein